MKRLLCLSSLAVSGILAAALPEAPMREWTDTADRKIQARIVTAGEGKVTLRRDDGLEFPIEISTLSEADQSYIKEWIELANTPPTVTEPIMSQTGRLLYSFDFAEIDGSWSQSHGEWSVEDGVLSGLELEADDHAAVMKQSTPLKDVVIEFEIQLPKGAGAALGLDNAKGHAARVAFNSNGLQARKDDNDREGPDEAKAFNQVEYEFDPEEWCQARVEVLGEEILTEIDEGISMGSDPLLATDMTKWGFVVTGGPVKFRNLRVWQALPNADWESERDRLARKLDLD